MKMNYPLTLAAALLLLVLAGCTDASNPVGPDTALHFSEATSSTGTNVAVLEKPSTDKVRTNAVVLAAAGKFIFSETTRTRSPRGLERFYERNQVSFSISQSTGRSKEDSGSLYFQDGDGPNFNVDVQHIEMNNDGSVSFNGPIDNSEEVGAAWFFARASDGEKTGDSFAYYLGESTDAPSDESFTTVRITEGDIIIYQNAF